LEWSFGEDPMLDVLMIALAAGFFAACLAYMVGCERLQQNDEL
jgi:hypothetical protein